MLAAASSFSSDKAYSFLNFLPLSLSSLDPYSDNVKSSHHTTPSCSLFLYVLLQRIAEWTSFSSLFCTPPEISTVWGILIAITPLGLKMDFDYHWSKDTSDPRREEIFNWVNFFDLLPLNVSDTMTLRHRSSSDSSFTPSSLALSCSWLCFRTRALITCQNCPSSPVFRPSERPPFFNFQKARWDDFAFYFNSHCPPAEEFSSLSSAAALFTSLTLNAVKFSIPFGRIKRQPKA